MEPGERQIDCVLRIAETRLKLVGQRIEDSEACRTPAGEDTKPSNLVEKRCHKFVVHHETMIAPVLITGEKAVGTIVND